MTKTEKMTSAEREGVIFIPDISGFTKFVHDTDLLKANVLNNEKDI